MKKGDKVEITKTRKSADTKLGEVYTIKSIDSFGIKLDSNYWVSTKEVKLIKTNMKKSDLKDGMTVKNRNGRIGKIVGNQIIYINGSDDFLLNFKDDLTSKHEEEEYDIVEVYESIWQREEPTELTMQEIADKFNIEVTNLKIKK